MSGIKGMLHYSTEIKVEAVRLYLEEQMSCHAIAKQMGIRKAERIMAWARAYRREGGLGLQKPKGRPPKKQDQTAYIARLEMENTLLKKFHEELRKLSKQKHATE
jgi:transposase